MIFDKDASIIYEPSNGFSFGLIVFVDIELGLMLKLRIQLKEVGGKLYIIGDDNDAGEFVRNPENDKFSGNKRSFKSRLMRPTYCAMVEEWLSSPEFSFTQRREKPTAYNNTPTAASGVDVF